MPVPYFYHSFHLRSFKLHRDTDLAEVRAAFAMTVRLARLLKREDLKVISRGSPFEECKPHATCKSLHACVFGVLRPCPIAAIAAFRRMVGRSARSHRQSRGGSDSADDGSRGGGGVAHLVKRGQAAASRRPSRQ